MLNDIFSIYKTNFKNNEENDFINKILKSAKSSQSFELIPKYMEPKNEIDHANNILIKPAKEEKISK